MTRLLTGLVLLLLTLGTCMVGAAEDATKVKIGVYDSRGVAIAYGRSTEFIQSVVEKWKADHAKAVADKDEKRAKELEQEQQWAEARLHLRGISTVGMSDILAKVSDALPGIAKEAGVTLIVSKWAMDYCDPSVETVDVTLPLARLFHPDEETLKTLEELGSQPPVPFDEMPLSE